MNPDLAAWTPQDQPPDAVVRTIIADDERLAREKLRLLLDSEASVEVVAECDDGTQTVSAVRTCHPDLLLLDIEMPGLDGFQVLSELSPPEMPAVIFTSAYDQYAIRAFEAHALDYLLKPFDQERLHRAMERVRAELHKSQDRAITHRILDLLSRVESERLLASEHENQSQGAGHFLGSRRNRLGRSRRQLCTAQCREGILSPSGDDQPHIGTPESRAFRAHSSFRNRQCAEDQRTNTGEQWRVCGSSEEWQGTVLQPRIPPRLAALD